MLEKYNTDKLYRGSKKIIAAMISNKVDEEIIKYATQLNKNGDPVFIPWQMEEILRGAVQGLSFDDIKSYALIHDGRSVYNAGQMIAIHEGITKGLPENLINTYAKLDSNIEPIYDQKQMHAIVTAASNKVPVKYIEKMTQLNKKGEPAYSWDQMEQICVGAQVDLSDEQFEYYTMIDSLGNGIYPGDNMRFIIYGFEEELSMEYIEIYSRLKDEKPIFNVDEIRTIYDRIIHHIKKEEFGRINQIKECVNEGLSFKELEPIIRPDLSTDKTRILRSFYSLGASVDDIKQLIEQNTSYDDLKEIKYLLQCVKEFNFLSNPILDEKINSIEEKRTVLSECIAAMRGTTYEENKKFTELTNKCLFYKMPPEQIKCIIESEELFAVDTVKKIAAGFLKGLNIEEFKELITLYMNDSDYRFKSLLKDIDNIINQKISADFDLDEFPDIKSEFDDFENLEK